jgi:hypothetical protein
MVNTNIDTYVGCSMTSMSDKEYSHFRKVVLEVCDVLDAKGMRSFRAPFEDTVSGFDSPAEVLDIDIKALESMQRFILIYTHKAASSSLIELGYAWKKGVPIDILLKSGVQLPYYLQDEDALLKHNIHMHKFDSEDELPKFVYEIFS